MLAALIEGVFSFISPGIFDKLLSDFFGESGVASIPLIYLPFVIAIIIGFSAIEEILKISVVKRFAYRDPYFNQIVDGAVFGISSALGFAVLENLGYFVIIAVQEGLALFIIVFIFRFFATTLLHSLTTGISGYYLGKSKFTGNRSFYLKGLLGAIALHSVFNLLLVVGVIGIGVNIILLLFTFVFLIRRMESFEAQTIWRLVLLKDLKAPPA